MSRAPNSSYVPVTGPYGCVHFDPVAERWRPALTAEGRELCARYLEDNPNIVGIAVVASPGQFKLLSTYLDNEEIAALVHEAVVWMFIRYDPDRGVGYSTVLAYQIKARFSDRIKALNKSAHETSVEFYTRGDSSYANGPATAGHVPEPADTGVPYPCDPDTAPVVDRLLACMNARARPIVRALFGLDSGCPRTYRDLAAEYHVSHQRIEQIARQALSAARALAPNSLDGANRMVVSVLAKGPATATQIAKLSGTTLTLARVVLRALYTAGLAERRCTRDEIIWSAVPIANNEKGCDHVRF